MMQTALANSNHSALNNRIRHAPAVLTAAALLTWWVLLALSRPLSHDEHMYVSAGALAGERLPYRDFAYLQMPYLPYVYRVFFAALPERDWWIAGRMISLAAGIVSACCILRIGRKASGSDTVAMLGLVFFATHHLVLFVLPLARNHVPASACVLVAYACWLRGTLSPRAGWWNLCAGSLSGCAVGLKLTTAVPALALLGLAAWHAGGRKTRRAAIAVLASHLLGLAAALAPAFLVMCAAGWETAFFNNYGYHRVNAEWREATNPRDATQVMDKLRDAGKVLISGSGAALLSALAVSCAVARMTKEQQRPVDQTRKNILISASVLTVASLLASLMPAPFQRDYLATAIPFLVTLTVGLLPRERFVASRAFRRCMIGLVAVNAAVAGIASVRHLRYLTDNAAATPMTLRKAADEIAQALADRGSGAARIATLAPILPLSAGLDIYPELATGPFLYRVGDEIDPMLLRTYVGTSSMLIQSLLDEDPPAGILVGMEPRLDASLTQYAETRGYETVDRTFGWGRLYLRK